MFCGIGVCFDCVVTVNGVRDVRACRRRARQGDEVLVQHDRCPARQPADPAARSGARLRSSWSAPVPRAWPPPCTRAPAARMSSCLDADDTLGGQFWRHLPATRPARREAVLHHGWQRFTGLRQRLAGDPGCRVLTGAQVWALEQAEGRAPTVHVLAGEADGPSRTAWTFTPDALVLATGAHDRTLPFPGWDLPGVFTAGAAQALAKGERVAVGRRVLVAGAGPFLLPVAASAGGGRRARGRRPGGERRRPAGPRLAAAALATCSAPAGRSPSWAATPAPACATGFPIAWAPRWWPPTATSGSRP